MTAKSDEIEGAGEDAADLQEKSIIAEWMRGWNSSVGLATKKTQDGMETSRETPAETEEISVAADRREDWAVGRR